MLAALLLPLLLAAPECSTPPPVNGGATQRLSLGPYLEAQATNATVTAQDLKQAPGCQRFAAIDQAQRQAWPSRITIWYRFILGAITNASDQVLTIPARGLPQVCVHWPLLEGNQSHCAGFGQERALALDYVFPLPNGLDRSRPILIAVDSAPVDPLPITLTTRAEQSQHQQLQQIGGGLLLGLVFAIVLFALLAWLRQGQSLLGYFAGWVLFSGLAIITFSGLGPTWGESTGSWSEQTLATGSSLAGLFFLCLFSRAYVGNNTRWWNRLCLALAAAHLGLTLSLVLAPSAGIKLLPMVTLATVGVLLSGLSGLAQQRQARAWVLLSALAVFAAGAMLAAAATLFNLAGVLSLATPIMLAGLLVLPVILVFNAYRQYEHLAQERNQARGALLAEQRLALLRSNYCRLTGLPTGPKVAELFARQTLASQAEHERIGIYLLHVDNLGQVRQQHGRAALEQAISILGMRLREGIKDDQFVARLDHWELLVVVPTNLRDKFRDRFDQAARNIRTALERNMVVDGHQLSVSVSVGLAIWPLHGNTFDELLRRCDSALYEAMAAGGNRFQVYNHKLHARRTDQFHKIEALRKALEQDQLELYYQPMVKAQSQRLYGLEALLRWRHPQMGLLLPDTFLPLIEDSELMLELGHWTLDRAMHDFTDLRRQGLAVPAIAVNISARQFCHPGLTRHITSCLSHYGVRPEQLHLEITEHSLIDNWERTRHVLSTLGRIGVRVWIDDFGVGYSSLNYLRALPIHGLKIDRSFVHNISRSDQDEAVVSAIARLASSLELDTIAEGVENLQQRDFLLQSGVRALQGHLF